MFPRERESAATYSLSLQRRPIPVYFSVLSDGKSKSKGAFQKEAYLL